MNTIRALIGATLVVATFGLAVAKLPPPPPMTDAQKAAAEEAKAKTAAGAALAKQQHAKAEDRVASQYFANMKAMGKSVPPSQMAATPPATPAAAAKTAPAAAPKK